MKRWVIALLLLLLGGVAVAQQSTTVNTIPGSVWTYLGPTFGAGWVYPPTAGLTVPACLPDGTSDNSSCVQTVLTALCAQKGGTLFLPAGAWKFHDITVPCDGVHIVGAGIGGIQEVTPNARPAVSKGTSVNCSDMVAFCIRWRPPVYPATVRIIGGSASRLRMFSSGSVGRFLDFLQVQAGAVHDVELDGRPSGIRAFGVLGFDIRNVQPRGNAGNAIEVAGDLSGKTQAGAACVSAGDCSTRTDLVNLNNITGYNALNEGTSVYIHDQAFTTVGNNIAMEGGQYGLRVTCAAGAPDISHCPQQITFADFETEYAVNPYHLTDFTFFRCSRCYGAGASVTATQNTMYLGFQNYAPITGTGGGVQITASEFFGANKSCIYVGVSDTQITGSTIFGCNGPNGSPTGDYASIEYNGTSAHSSQGNFFCTGLRAVSTNQYGIVITGDVQDMTTTGDHFRGCQRTPGDLHPVPILNNSTVPYDVRISNMQPVPDSGVVSNIAGCGTGCTVTFFSGNLYGGSLVITPGPGAAASGSFDFSLRMPLYPYPLCGLQPRDGSNPWQGTATANTAQTTADPGKVTVKWANGSTPLASPGGYFLDYRCNGF